MDDRQLVLYYQPKVSVKTGFVVGVEALVRWHHPTRRVLCPGSFIGLAEQTGLIRVLTPYILEEALSQCRAWQDQGIRLPVAVNLSARNLSDPSLTSTIERLLDRYGVDPRWLTLEVTESAMMLERAHVLEDLRRLHGAGIGVSIDDFGTGHSSLAYLSRLPVSELKIDQSFVTDMARNYHHSFIVRTITDLGHNLHLGVVAEGIENELTLGLLGAVGCDTVQGFHLCPPLPPSELEAWLTDRTIARSA
jgi:EAL domain-containing protein (putative c-di-GMP-specific phosphodiesterase class I)